MKAYAYRFGKVITFDVEGVKDAIEVCESVDADSFASYAILYAVIDDQNNLVYDHKGNLASFYKQYGNVREDAARPITYTQKDGATVTDFKAQEAQEHLPSFTRAAQVFNQIKR